MCKETGSISAHPYDTHAQLPGMQPTARRPAHKMHTQMHT
jgi:hypothetical protein